MISRSIVYLLLVFCGSLSAQMMETVVQLGHRKNIKCLAIDHQHKILASGSKDRSIILWDLDTKRQIRTINAHDATVMSVQFTADDKAIISSGADQRLRMWDVATGKLLKELYRDVDYITTVAIHPTRKVIAFGGYPFDFKILNYETLELIKEIKCNPDKGSGAAISLQFSKDGKYLAIGEDNKEGRVFDATTFEELMTIKNTYGWCGGCGTDLHFSQHGQYLVKTSHNDSLKIYDFEHKKLISKRGRAYDKISNAVFFNNDKGVIYTSDDSLFVWEDLDGDKVKKYDLAYLKLGEVNHISLLDSRHSVLIANSSGRIVEIGVLNGKHLGDFTGANVDYDRGGLDYDPDSYWDSHIAKYMYLKNYFMLMDGGKSFLTGKMGLNAIKWNLVTGQPVNFYGENTKAVICFDVLESKSMFVTGNGAGEILIWDLKKNVLLKKIKAHRDAIFTIKISEKLGQIIASSWDASMTAWDIETFEKVNTIDFKDNYSAFSFEIAKNGLYIILGRLNKTLQLMEPDTKEIVKTLSGHTDVVSSIRENVFTKEILTSSWDGTARVWDLGSGLMNLKLKAPGNMYSAIYHPDHTKIFTAGSDAVIRVWSSNTGKLLFTLSGHSAEVTQLEISQDGKYLYSLSVDGVLKYWDIDKKEELYTHIRLSDREWMVKSPTGYFNATSGARNAINFVKGNDVYKPDQFFDKYYRPDLLEKLFYRKARLGNLEEDLERSYTESIKLALSPNNDGKTGVLYLKIPQANIGLLEQVKLSHNGRMVNTSISHKADSNGAKVKNIKISVDLVSGMNVFSVHPVSKNQIESKSSEVRYFAERANFETNCHLFVIGINEYENPAMRLSYARNDAQSFIDEYTKNARSLFKEIKVHSFFDLQATKSNILDSLENLSKNIALHDMLIFYYAGHGSMVDEMFYLIPQNCGRLYDPNKVGVLGISAKDLQGVFSKIKALKQVVILDACQSGGGVATLAMRGANEEKAMAQLSRSAGVHIFASAGSEQNAKEIEELKHGLFTYVLLNALDGKADGSPRDEKVTVYELKSYLDDQVPELNQKYSGKLQFPYTFSLGQDFPLIYLKD